MFAIITVGILSTVIIVQEFRIHKLVERLLLQASIPTLEPVRTSAPVSAPDPEKPQGRRKMFSVQIPD